MQRQELVKSNTGICECGNPGKPIVSQTGGVGYVCKTCFIKSMRAFSKV